MSDTAVSLLTPPGVGAIATVEVRGPRAWQLARALFTPVGKPVPEAAELHRFWFGTLGGDEVILAVPDHGAIEVHCHGGRRVVRTVIEQFLAHDCIEERNPRPKGEGFELLQRAPTLRTASILLDQLHGAFANEVRRILTLIETDPAEARGAVQRLAELGTTVGRHLVEPWRVAIAGPPNVGKSSLVNALAGYQRAVVSEVAGTTRDAVSVRTAFDGWPVELIDTAGLRAAEGLESQGIEHARRVVAEADLVVWVMDVSSRDEVYPNAEIETARSVLVFNKCDRTPGWQPNDPPGAIHLSATTGENVSLLADRIARQLVPNAPAPGAAVPYTPRLIEAIRSALASAEDEKWDEVVRLHLSSV